MNDVIKTILERRSVREYKSDMVKDELIDEIVKAGTYAPSGRGAQSPIIIAITNKKIRDKLASINAKIAVELQIHFMELQLFLSS